MNRFVGINKAPQTLDVSISTLRRWEAEDTIISKHTARSHHRYNLSKLRLKLFRSEEPTQ
nr:hypothetical protein [Bartonella alsatica]